MHGVLHHHPVSDAALLPGRHTRRLEIKSSHWLEAESQRLENEDLSVPYVRIELSWRASVVSGFVALSSLWVSSKMETQYLCVYLFVYMCVC
jgi:hypothetical protein